MTQYIVHVPDLPEGTPKTQAWVDTDARTIQKLITTSAAFQHRPTTPAVQVSEFDATTPTARFVQIADDLHDHLNAHRPDWHETKRLLSILRGH